MNSLNLEVNKNASEPLRESVEIFNTSIFGTFKRYLDFSPTDPIEFDNLTQRIYLLGRNMFEKYNIESNQFRRHSIFVAAMSKNTDHSV